MTRSTTAGPASARPLASPGARCASLRPCCKTHRPALTHGPPVVLSQTIQLLLNQLSVIHERQQTTQRAAWDAFLRKRQLTRSESSSEGFVGFAAMATSGKTGKDDHREFVKLVRGGIPIVYRSKVWLECSGAHDLMAPGEYAELLEQAEREGIASTTLAEIEKDVVRTLVRPRRREPGLGTHADFSPSCSLSTSSLAATVPACRNCAGCSPPTPGASSAFLPAGARR